MLRKIPICKGESAGSILDYKPIVQEGMEASVIIYNKESLLLVNYSPAVVV